VTNASFNITITDDDASENEEDFNLMIDSGSLPAGVNTGNLVQSRVVIVDNDGEQNIKGILYCF